MIEEGDQLPDIELNKPDGTTVKPSVYRGSPLVLYFYPKDDTPGCTKEAIAFSELMPEFRKAGVSVLGVSKDPPAKHEKFIDKHDLSVPLASDEEGALIEAMGSWVEKNMYGRKYMGIERSTFLADGDGKLVRIWRKVRVKGHAEEVLEAAKALG